MLERSVASAGRRQRSQFADSPRRHRPDYVLVILSTLLIAIGLILVYAISPALSVEKNVSGSYYVTRQLIAVGLSVVAFGVMAAIPLERWRQWRTPLLVAAGAVTLFALILPANPQYPAHRWIRLGSLSFQSVELLKFALLVWLAGLLNERIREGVIPDAKPLLKQLAMVFVGSGIIVAGVQSDFGSMMVITAIMAVMVFLAGIPMKRVLLVATVLIIGMILAVSTVPYRRARIVAFLHQGSSSNCASLETGYQACQALIAVGSGGLIGLGLGRSVQAYGYLPEAENDSIFAIYAEKFGFIGVTLLIALFVAFFSRLKRIIERAPDTFTRLIVAGVAAWLSTQALINIGAMVGLLPLKGITLPFISYGGTSLLFVTGAIGLVFQISRYTSLSAPRVSAAGQGRREAFGGVDRRRNI